MPASPSATPRIAPAPPPRPRRGSAAALAAAVLALAGAAAALAQGIQVTIDRTEATIEDQLVLTVTVAGSQEARPELPPLPEFRVLPRGQSTQVQIVNGQMSASVGYNYVLVPTRTGTFTIGPARVDLDGRSYQSRPFTVRILPASAQPQASRDLFITAGVSDAAPYLGQQVLYTWRFYRRVQITDPRLEAFEFPGFVTQDLGDVKEYQSSLGGQAYLVSEIKKALFPQEEGKLTIPGPTLSCGVVVQQRGRGRSVFDDFFGRYQSQAKVLRTDPVEVRVRPLPAAPAGFSGLVGSFDIQAEVSKRQLRVGESTTFKLTVSGSGNAQMIGEPKLPPLAAFKVYEDKPSASVDATDSGVAGRKSFVKALVPLAPGEVTLPPVSLTYFDPKSGSYRTASTAPIALAVRPAEGKEELRLTESVAPTTGKVAVKILADDILPLHKALAPMAGGGSLGGAREAFWWGGLAAPALGFFGVLLARRRQERFALDAGLRRRRGAPGRARAALARVEAAEQAGDPLAACRLASRCLREFVGDKLGLEGAALTPGEVDGHLRSRGVAEEVVTATHRLLADLEAAQYGARAAGNGDGSSLAGEIRKLLGELDRSIRD
jgi:BatD DUF11 like domain